MHIPEGFTAASGVTRGELLHRGLAAGLAVGAVGVLSDEARATQVPEAWQAPDGLANGTGIHRFRVRLPRG